MAKTAKLTTAAATENPSKPRSPYALAYDDAGLDYEMRVTYTGKALNLAHIRKLTIHDFRFDGAYPDDRTLTNVVVCCTALLKSGGLMFIGAYVSELQRHESEEVPGPAGSESVAKIAQAERAAAKAAAAEAKAAAKAAAEAKAAKAAAAAKAAKAKAQAEAKAVRAAAQAKRAKAAAKAA